MNREIKLYKSRYKATTIVLVSVTLLIAGIMLILNTDKTVAAWSIIILSGFGLLLGISTQFDRRPYIIMNETGISDRTLGNELIEWSAIKSIRPFHFRGQYYIRIVVDKNYKTSLPGNRFYRLDRMNDQAGIKALYIKISMIDADSSKLIPFLKAIVNASPIQRRELILQVPGFSKND